MPCRRNPAAKPRGESGCHRFRQVDKVVIKWSGNVFGIGPRPAESGNNLALTGVGHACLAGGTASAAQNEGCDETVADPVFYPRARLDHNTAVFVTQN